MSFGKKEGQMSMGPIRNEAARRKVAQTPSVIEANARMRVIAKGNISGLPPAPAKTEREKVQRVAKLFGGDRRKARALLEEAREHDAADRRKLGEDF